MAGEQQQVTVLFVDLVETPKSSEHWMASSGSPLSG
jgi:hypothetical protein